MALSSRTIQVKIKSNGDVFHELWKANPHQVPNLTPATIQNCQLHEGDVGTVGSVLFWNYFHDGKDCVIKMLIQELDEGKKLVSLKALEGNLLELYKTFVTHIKVDTDGSDNFVTWTVDYEKLSPNDPDPNTLMDFFKKVTQDIEAHHLQN